MSRKNELLSILKIAQDSVDLEIKESSNLIKQSYAMFKKPLLVSVSRTEDNTIAAKVYAYAITCDGSNYYLYKDEYKNGSAKRTKFIASREDTMGFLKQSLYETNQKASKDVVSAGGSTQKSAG